MIQTHVFVETSFLFGVFKLPSKRDRDALELKGRLEAGELRIYVPYLCFQEAANLIAKELRDTRYSDLRGFDRFATATGLKEWNFEEVEKLVTAAEAEVNQTHARHRRELEDFAAALGDDLLHGTCEVFDFLANLQLDHDLQYNDKLILSSVLVEGSRFAHAC